MSTRRSVQKAELIELAEVTSWPTDVVALLRKASSAFPKRPRPYATDLRFGPDIDESFERQLRGMLADRLLAMYHATRLLPEEIEVIRAQGIQLLTPALRAMKLRTLVDRGLMSRAESDTWESLGPLTWPGQESRLNEASIFAPLECLREPDLFQSLLHDWGGESISRAATKPGREGADDIADGLRSLLRRVNEVSTPSVIAVAVSAADLPRSPYLWQVMIGRLVRALKPCNEWHVKTPLPVTDVIQPGHSRWKSTWLRRR